MDNIRKFIARTCLRIESPDSSSLDIDHTQNESADSALFAKNGSI